MNPIAHRSNHPQPRRLSALIHAAFMLPVLAGASAAQAQAAAAPAATPASAAAPAKAEDDVQKVST